jgi:hypothetical protein
MKLALLCCALMAALGARASEAPVAPQLAGLTIKSEFVSGLGTLVGVGFSSSANRAWAYGAFGTVLQSFTRAGVTKTSVPRPGEAANDADVEVAHVAFTLAGTALPAGTLLFINGETGVAEIYAQDPVSGATLATLTTGFGNSHVVGGGYHAKRKTLFLLQDKVPGGASASLVAEVSPATGAVLRSFQISPAFVVNYGDLDVNKSTGNLFVVSSDEARIAEFTPTGTLVQYYALPAGVSSLSGIAIDDKRAEIWVSGTGGKIWCLGITAASASVESE